MCTQISKDTIANVKLIDSTVGFLYLLFGNGLASQANIAFCGLTHISVPDLFPEKTTTELHFPTITFGGECWGKQVRSMKIGRKEFILNHRRGLD